MKGLAVALLVAIPAYADAPKKLAELEATRIDDLEHGDKADFIDSARLTVSASSTLADKKDAYAAKNLIDDKLDTAWCEGDKGDGEGASLTITLDKAADIGGFTIAPHYAKDFARAWKNNRVAKLEIATDEGTGTVAFDDLAAWVRKHHTDQEVGGDIDAASRDERIQIGIGFDVAFTPVKTKTVKLTIRGVHAGSVHDTCISEIRLHK